MSLIELNDFYGRVGNDATRKQVNFLKNKAFYKRREFR